MNVVYIKYSKFIFGYFYMFILSSDVIFYIHNHEKTSFFLLITIFKHFCQWMMRIYSHAFAIALHPKFRLCHIVILYLFFSSRNQKVPHNMLFTRLFPITSLSFFLIIHTFFRHIQL